MNSGRTDNNFSMERELQARLEDNRTFFQQVIGDFDFRTAKRLDELCARMDEFWDNEDSGISLQSKEHLEEEIKEPSINENLEKRQRSLEQKLKKTKKPPHKKSFSCVYKGFQKLIKSAKAREIIEQTNGKMDAQSYSGCFSKISETQNDPEFSKILLKWPPEGSPLTPIPLNSGTNGEGTEDFIPLQSAKRIIQQHTAAVAKHLEEANTHGTNCIKELEMEAKRLEMEFKKLENKIEPQNGAILSQDAERSSKGS